MPTPANFFLPMTTNYPGSAGNAASIYPIVWNPVTRRTESKNPNFTPTAPLAPIFTGLSGQPPLANQPNIAAPAVAAQTAAGSSPVYPLNVPTGPGISTISVPKSSQISDATSSVFAGLKALGETQNQVLADFKARFPEWFAGQEKASATENAATQGLFTGDAQARSDANVENFLAQANAANAKSIADVQRLTSRSALASDASGYSSARDRGRFATIADINAKAARDAAAAKLTSDQWLTQLQQQMAGAQAARNRLLVGDRLLPSTVEASNLDAFSRILGQLSQTELNNLIAGVVAQGGYVGDTFGGLQAAKIGDVARMSDAARVADASNLNWANARDRSNLNWAVLNRNALTPTANVGAAYDQFS